VGERIADTRHLPEGVDRYGRRVPEPPDDLVSDSARQHEQDTRQRLSNVIQREWSRQPDPPLRSGSLRCEARHAKKTDYPQNRITKYKKSWKSISEARPQNKRLCQTNAGKQEASPITHSSATHWRNPDSETCEFTLTTESGARS
jgi:hypothetical protein